jgi:hypothetical protein
MLSRELGVSNEVVSGLLTDTEIEPISAEESLRRQISDLTDELVMDLETASGDLVFSGFIHNGGGTSPLKRLADEIIGEALGSLPALSRVADGKLERFLEELELDYSDLMDTDIALKVATALRADYIVTGSIIEMPSSVILFARALNRKTGTAESVVQLILPLDESIRSLLVPPSSQPTHGKP